MTKWQIVLDEKLDKLLQSTKVLKSSVKMLHEDFNHIDRFIDSLDVTFEYNNIDQEIIPTLLLPCFDDDFDDDFVFPDFYYLSYKTSRNFSCTMPHVFIV